MSNFKNKAILPSAKMLEYQPPFYLKYGPAIIASSIVSLILFMIFTVQSRQTDVKDTTFKLAKDSMNISAKNIANEIIQITKFTYQTNNLLSAKLKKDNNLPDLSQLYLGTQGIKLQVINNEGLIVAQSRGSDKSIKESPGSFKLLPGEHAILPSEDGSLRLLGSSLNNNLYPLYIIPASTLDDLIKTSLIYKSGTMTIEDSSQKILVKIPVNAVQPEVMESTTLLKNYKVNIYVSVSEALKEVDIRRNYTVKSTAAGVIFVFLISLIGFWSVKKLKANAKELHELFCLDILTHLPNRRAFNELIEDRAQNKQKKLGLLFIDLDNFKHINDTLGHDKGDLLLVEVAQRLSDSIGPQDIAFRLGGDEFTVLLVDVESIENANEVANKILEALAQPFDLEENTIITKGSLGLALMPIHAKDTADLIKFADTAMYYAKENGKGCCMTYEPHMVSKADKQAQKENNFVAK